MSWTKEEFEELEQLCKRILEKKVVIGQLTLLDLKKKWQRKAKQEVFDKIKKVMGTDYPDSWLERIEKEAT